jgi:uncharacterized protein
MINLKANAGVRPAILSATHSARGFNSLPSEGWPATRGKAFAVNPALQYKLERLRTRLRHLGSLGLAYSGGVDSTLLLDVAHEVLGEHVVALTVDSPLQSRREVAEALATARRLGVTPRVLKPPIMEVEALRHNPSDRCYACKRLIFGVMREALVPLAVAHLAHGANIDDFQDHRPGFAAAREMGILAPLVDADLSKAEIRELSRQRGLPTWNRPSMACLASRVPYGTAVTRELLARVEAAEEILRGAGFDGLRVRAHGELARIELSPDDIPRLARPEIRAGIVAGLKAAGFRYVALDLEGYVTGSLNPKAGTVS